MIKEILFVYNADSGLMNGFKDLLHKINSPDTYPCHLCAVTYGLIGMHAEWKAFIRSLPYQVVFLHRDELPSELPQAEYPCSYVRTNQGISLLLNRDQIQSCETVSDLIIQVNHALTHS